MEQLTTRIGIEPGPGLVGRFGDTVIVIPRGDEAGSAPPAAGAVQELLGPGRRGRLRPAGAGQRDRQPPGRLGYRPHVGGRSRVRDRGPDARWRGHVPARRGVVHDHRGRLDPRGIRRAGPHLGRPDRARHVRAAGDRRRGRPAGTGGPAVRPVGRGGARAGLRAEPDRGYPRDRALPERNRPGRGRSAASDPVRAAAAAAGCGCGCVLAALVLAASRGHRPRRHRGRRRTSRRSLGAPGRGPEPPADDGRADR